ncbi:putative uncharacterized protein DDB_G0281311 [Schistocerca americana]|uniref:putative uncharacterized protein DDB_G0281311 n=1 Tax=Schistocerca americana TaxID=7009 RepID=UPI001F4F54BD|nr:putative uncharacterized protein DDB_G0281311 [Schistocerca americana]
MNRYSGALLNIERKDRQNFDYGRPNWINNIHNNNNNNKQGRFSGNNYGNFLTEREQMQHNQNYMQTEMITDYYKTETENIHNVRAYDDDDVKTITTDNNQLLNFVCDDDRVVEVLQMNIATLDEEY